jgi:mono/diheme cytochrome c family protein
MRNWRVAIALFVPLSAVLIAAPNLAHAQDECAELTKPPKLAHAKDIGKVQYEAYCAGCHGISGKGDGPLRKCLTKPPADLSQLQTRNGGQFPTTGLFDIIDGREEVAAHGPRDMPVWGKTFKKEDTTEVTCETDECFYSKFWRGRILALINYIRTLQVVSPISGDREW